MRKKGRELFARKGKLAFFPFSHLQFFSTSLFESVSVLPVGVVRTDGLDGFSLDDALREAFASSLSIIDPRRAGALSSFHEILESDLVTS